MRAYIARLLRLLARRIDTTPPLVRVFISADMAGYVEGMERA